MLDKNEQWFYGITKIFIDVNNLMLTNVFPNVIFYMAQEGYATN